MNEQLIEKLKLLAEEFGAEEFDSTLNALDDFEPIDTGGTTCPAGYKWSTRLKKCIQDPG